MCVIFFERQNAWMCSTRHAHERAGGRKEASVLVIGAQNHLKREKPRTSHSQKCWWICVRLSLKDNLNECLQCNDQVEESNSRFIHKQVIVSEPSQAWGGRGLPFWNLPHIKSFFSESVPRKLESESGIFLIHFYYHAWQSYERGHGSINWLNL